MEDGTIPFLLNTEPYLGKVDIAEAANGGVLQIICSAAARKLNMFEEHLLGALFVHFNSFFQNFSCRTHFNFARKQNFLAEHIKILPGNLEMRKIGLKLYKFFIFLQNTFLYVKQTEVC